MVSVQEFLAADLKRRWVWGQNDCSLFVANWILAKTGVDIAKGYRGTYDDENSAALILRSQGGILAWCGHHLREFGWELVDVPQEGDVAVVRAPMAPHGHIGHLPAVRAGGMWVVRCETGQRSSELFEPKAIWRG